MAIGGRELQFFLGGLQMGLLDEVIGAALRSRAGSGIPQSAQGQPAQAQYSQIAAALTKLLASRAAAASAVGQ